jgi:1-acylglycerone phosphate reductase
MSQRQQVAVVTGASSGIGLQVSKQLAQKGWKVYGCARRVDPMKPLEEFGVIPVQLDVTSAESVQKFKEFLAEDLSDAKVDVLYNNAGQSCTFPAFDVTDAQIQQAFDVNVIAPMRLTRELQDFLINAKGTILFTGSLAGVVPFPFSSVYCSCKAAIHQYAHALHLELKGFSVRVINVVTGGVETNIADTRSLPSGSKFDFPVAQQIFEARKHMAKKNRPMSPEVYAKKVIKDILSSRDPIDVYRGSFATILSAVSQYFPGWVLELILTVKFKLSPIFSYQKKKYGEGVDFHLE